MPLEKMTKLLMFVSLFLFVVASAFFVVYATIATLSLGNAKIEALMYIGAMVLFVSVVDATIGILFWIAGYAMIPWVTHAMCRADKFRAGQVFEQRIARQYVQQHIRY